MEFRLAGAVRFYPKKNGEFSLYQFAIAPEFRGQGLARPLLDAVRQGQPMRSQYPATLDFNGCYERIGWRLEGVHGEFKHWILD